jgi:hypothetical protein
MCLEVTFELSRSYWNEMDLGDAVRRNKEHAISEYELDVVILVKSGIETSTLSIIHFPHKCLPFQAKPSQWPTVRSS